MRIHRIALSWSVFALVAATGGCAGGWHLPPSPGEAPSARLSRVEYWRQLRDSSRAQAIADEVGPRVSLRANFDETSGSRRVEATFHLYDDAYVIVGHLDATGRMRIVFPSSPDDNGFVKGDKVYHVPAFFAGFADEYRWRYSEYNYRFHNSASRQDSYDAGLGYVFVIASWRPMRLDRITDGDRWQSYEISDVSYMPDPREAIEELGALLAGDNREAYTVEYARYSTTNFGAYSLRSFASCYGLGYGSGYGSRYGLGVYGFGYNRYGFSPFGFSSNGCGGAPYGYGYSRYAFASPLGGYSVPVTAPPVTPLPPRIPGMPITRRPRQPGDGGAADTVSHASPRLPSQEPKPADAAGAASPTDPNLAYRRRGLLAEDAGGRDGAGQGRRRNSGSDIGTYRDQPRIQDMLARRRFDEAGRDGSGSARVGGDSPSQPGGNYRGGVTRERVREADGGYNSPPRGVSGERHSGGGDGSSARGATRGEPRGEGSGYSRPSAPTRSEPSSVSPRPSTPPPAPPPRAEPSGSAERRKPSP
jgi:hypothetical protein